MIQRCFIALSITLTTLSTHRTIAQEKSTEDDPLAVVSYNIRYASPRDGEDVWQNRVDTVTKFLADYDVIGLQEVTAKQFADVRAALPGHRAYGLGRDDGRSGGEAAAVLYRDDRFLALAQGTIWLAEDPTAVGVKAWDAAFPRTMSWVVLRDQNTKHAFVFANTHFDHVGKQARENSGKLISEFLTNRFDGLPVVLLGDFNCVPGSPPHDAITKHLQDAHAIDSADVTGPDSTWNGFKNIVPGRRIDHIFVSDNVDVASVSILDPKTPTGRFGSDHLPIAAEVSFAANEPSDQSASVQIDIPLSEGTVVRKMVAESEHQFRR